VFCVWNNDKLNCEVDAQRLATTPQTQQKKSFVLSVSGFTHSLSFMSTYAFEFRPKDPKRNVIPITQNELYLGRGGIAGINDKQVSRQQVNSPQQLVASF
jgi:hypothetical protein